ncbi:hypothetical protein JB92DRAFT_3135684 [Gautieria morchelliformis]|nr:hypothetical protein JB92DRAFT_3135684 [Gautieria morchelliformis]
MPPVVPAATPAAELELKHDIIKRTSVFHSLRMCNVHCWLLPARYLHERIQDVRMIKIVPAKALPCTVVKGNIRRRAVEQDFASNLEAMYTSFPQE